MTATTMSGLPLISAASKASWYLKLFSALSNAEAIGRRAFDDHLARCQQQGGGGVEAATVSA